ncbi:MAG: AMIN domain-containing protein [Cyanothece sp. SIO1E1]|nr:AMIN domain-containing protein [Cyanothece sp. SIO1E1]
MVKQHFGLGSLVASSALVVLAAQSVSAAPTTVTAVQLQPTGDGLEVVLRTESGDRPQIFTVSRGNILTADIINTQLSLPGGSSFIENNPAPGIAVVTVMQLDANSIRVLVSGTDTAPSGQVSSQDGDNITLNFTSSGDNGPIADNGGDDAADNGGDDTTVVQAPAPGTPPSSEPTPAPDTPDVLVPNPEVTIDGVPIPAPTPQTVPPFLPRAIAPPVGDIAVATTDAAFDAIDLGTAERVPRLVLREAPAREVLSLLARAASLNVAFTPGVDDEGNITDENPEGPKISLDIENEPVQDVFNAVLRISGLEANLVGRTIYVGPRLPNAARNLIVRSLRLNQIDATVAVDYLVGLGAESAVSREIIVETTEAAEVGEDVDLPEQTQTTTGGQVQVQRADFEDAVPILRGMQVLGDERSNSITLIGTPRQIEIATTQMTQLDIRRRQVAVNVRVIDVDLDALDEFGSSFSFGVNDTFVTQEGGSAVINFGDDIPAGTDAIPGLLTGEPALSTPQFDFEFATQFLLQLQAAVTNEDAKILTDPTLIVQEGQTAVVQLTEEVVTDIDVTVNVVDTGTVTTTDFELEDVGLNVQVQVERIDDNGFVTLSVAPSISAPGDTFSVGPDLAVLITRRELSSGLIRIRDGQTLFLSGIIQESDTVTTTKVPILGDIPLLGALFRNTDRDSSRSEVIIVVTPRILDDSDQSTFGYSYFPRTAEAQELLSR